MKGISFFVALFFLFFITQTLVSAAPSEDDGEMTVGSFTRSCIAGKECGCIYHVEERSPDGVREYDEGPNCKLAPKGCNRPCFDDDFPADPTVEGIHRLMPDPLPPESEDTRRAKQTIEGILQQYPHLKGIYQEAEAETGVPWEILAGIHFREGHGDPAHAFPNNSLVSGRAIGIREPDINPKACSRQGAGRGDPIPVGGGCGFRSVLDSAIYAAKHLKGNVAELKDYDDLVKAVSSYNGRGNSNCDEDPPLRYYAENPNRCPTMIRGYSNRLRKWIMLPGPPFTGDDDPYATHYFDTEHRNMSVIFCTDNRVCPRPDDRPGVLAIVRGLL